MKSIAICASVAFYEEVVKIAEVLRQQGLRVVIPRTAELMQSKNDFDITHFTHQATPDGTVKTKTDFIREMFNEIPSVDAILLVNSTKHGEANYIGANAFLELGIGFYLKKKLFLLNDFPDNSAFNDELRGMAPVCLYGNLGNINL